jgi:serine/threonine protein kinase
MKDTLIGNRYLVLEPIGSGGEARVFRASDTMMGNEIALRVPHQPVPSQIPAALPLFHNTWVQLLDSGTDSPCGPYQVFELLQGATLHRLISNGPLDGEEWYSFVQQSLDAVGALHIAGWIHGDLNADNFFRLEDKPECWKLLELPFLRFSPPADRSALFGGIHTLAPEQFDGAAANAGSDLYSLGCLYYYAASGQYPHDGRSSQEVAVNCLRFDPVDLSERAPRLPASWSAWVMNLLAREPQKRSPTVAAARQLLKKSKL